jgi:DNA repair exonuclease SbcCD nuclease subunit
LLGNHDFDILQYPTAKLFDLHLVTQPQCFTRDDGVKIAFLPYQRDFETFIKEWKKLNEENPDILFFHQEIPGVEYETGRKIGGLFPQTLFLPRSLYISGHIHKHQTVGKTLYVGSPYQTKFSDEGQTRYIWLLNGKTKEYAPIKLNYPEFKSIDIQTGYKPEGIISIEGLQEKVAGNYIRVVGEVPASQWDIQTRKEIKADLEKAGAKGISFQVQVIKQRQTQIPADKIDDDESIIRLFVDNNFGDSKLDNGEILKVGLDLFKTR